MTTIMHSRIRGAARFAGICAVAALAACGDFLKVTNPGPIADDKLNVPDAVPGLVTGMSADFSVAFDDIVRLSGVASDDISHGGSYTFEGLWVRGIIRPEDVNNEWAQSQRARWVAEQGIVRMKQVAGYDFDKNALSAKAHVWVALANRTLGENFCNAVIDNGPKQSDTVYFQRAEAAATEAIRIASALTGATAVQALNAAYGVRASALAWQGKWTEAAADAAKVPTNFVFNAVYSTNSGRENNSLVAETWVRREFSVFGTPWAKVFGDTRVPWDTLKTSSGAIQKGQDGKTNYFRQRKFVDLGSEMPLVQGTEMLVLRAEAALRTGDIAGTYTLLNQARAFYGMPALTPAATVADAWKTLEFERGATLWLQARRLWDLRRWYADAGPAKNTFLEGRDKCIPISQQEQAANPNLSK